MENIDDDMMEAAQSLGANRLSAFMKVIFPMSLPGIIVGGILVFTGTLTAYTTPQLLGGQQQYGAGNPDLSESNVGGGLERRFRGGTDYDSGNPCSGEGIQCSCLKTGQKRW